MLYLRIQTLELENITSEWVVSEIKLELDTLNRIRRTDYLNDKMNGGTNSDIGFPMQTSTHDDEDEDCVDICEEPCAEEPSAEISMKFTSNEQESSGGYQYRGGAEAPVSEGKSMIKESGENNTTEQTL